VPGLRSAEVQLKERVEVRTSKRDLPKEHPEYDATSWSSVVTGHKYAYNSRGLHEDEDEVSLHDYLESRAGPQ